jgi:hypothetical protein
MLSVYTRHYPPCPRTDIHYRRCRCPKWIRGVFENGDRVRLSARTRSWVDAERKAREMERAASGRITVECAVQACAQPLATGTFGANRRSSVA